MVGDGFEGKCSKDVTQLLEATSSDMAMRHDQKFPEIYGSVSEDEARDILFPVDYDSDQSDKSYGLTFLFSETVDEERLKLFEAEDVCQVTSGDGFDNSRPCNSIKHKDTRPSEIGFEIDPGGTPNGEPDEVEEFSVEETPEHKGSIPELPLKTNSEESEKTERNAICKPCLENETAQALDEGPSGTGKSSDSEKIQAGEQSIATLEEIGISSDSSAREVEVTVASRILGSVSSAQIENASGLQQIRSPILREAMSAVSSPQNMEECNLSDSESTVEEPSSPLYSRKNSKVRKQAVKFPDLLSKRESAGNNPAKRRRGDFSSAHGMSLKFHRFSLCGFEDFLYDGFFDAGRFKTFKTLETLRAEQVGSYGRDVVVVDRFIDEDLDVILKTAGQILNQSVSATVMNDSLRVASLALFVSNCFGGSSRTRRVLSARVQAIGSGKFTSPNLDLHPILKESSMSEVQTVSSANMERNFGSLVGCGCAVKGGQTSEPLFDSVYHSLTDFDRMCDSAVQMLKGKLKSNVIPVGMLPYGVCRHRSILFKYLCDRLSPPIPCQLVRGYHKQSPHAWNVVRIQRQTAGHKQEAPLSADSEEGENGDSDAPVKHRLVDCCHPEEIRCADDADMRASYIPLICLEPGFWAEHPELCPAGDSFEVLERLEFGPLLGEGGSGAYVVQCSLSGRPMAAKIRSLRAPQPPNVPSAAPALPVFIPGLPAASQSHAQAWTPGLSYVHELSLLRSLPCHPHVLPLLGHWVTSPSSPLLSCPAAGSCARTSARSSQESENPSQLALLFPLMQGGSLGNLLQRVCDLQSPEAEGVPACLSLPLIVHVGLGVAMALDFLHSLSLVHRDVKSANVLLASALSAQEAVQRNPAAAATSEPCSLPCVKLCDFDASVSVHMADRHGCAAAWTGATPADSLAGTPPWMAPEMHRMHGTPADTAPVTTAVDMWSFGCLLYEMLTLSMPYKCLTAEQLRGSVQFGMRPELPPHLAELAGEDGADSALGSLVSLFLECTQICPSQRPSASEAVSSLLSVRNRLDRDLQERSTEEEKRGIDCSVEDRAPTAAADGTESTGQEEGITAVDSAAEGGEPAVGEGELAGDAAEPVV